MIPALLCQVLPEDEPAPGGQGLVDLDFILGNYFVDREPVAIADVLDHPEWITANGLEMLFEHETDPGTAIAHLIGDALAHALTANWTLVIEWQELFGGSTPFQMTANSPVWTDVLQLQQGFPGTDDCYVYEDDGDVRDTSATSSAPLEGIHKVAITRTNSELSISVDGSAAVTAGEAASSGISPTEATLGGFDGDSVSSDIYIRSFLLLEPQPDEQLPVLSAI